MELSHRKEVVKHGTHYNVEWLTGFIRSSDCRRSEVIFGYPGGAIMPIYEALYDTTTS